MLFGDELLEEEAYYEWGFREAKMAGNIAAVESLISDLNRFACLNPYASHIFSAAQNGAENVLDQLIRKGESKWISRN